jgi:hypothetical protein
MTIDTIEARKRFILAGNATFTIVSRKTGTRYTYRVRHKEGKPHYVSVLTGPDSYTYLGEIFNVGYRPRTKLPSSFAFMWLWLNLGSSRIEFHHAGKCGRCGRELTVPESIESGLGPECAKKTGYVPTSVESPSKSQHELDGDRLYEGW